MKKCIQYNATGMLDSFGNLFPYRFGASSGLSSLFFLVWRKNALFEINVTQEPGLLIIL